MTNRDIALIMKCVNGTPINWMDWILSSRECYLLIKNSPNFKRIHTGCGAPDDTFIYVGPKAEEAT